MQIRAEGGQLVVRRGETLWNAESGQAHFDFEVDQLAEIATPQLKGYVEDERDFEDELDAEDWYGVGLDLEVAAPEHARDAYRRALELDPDHVDARINLGRLLLESEQFPAAEANFRNVISRFPNHALAHYNLGVCLEDQGGHKEAIDAYRAAIHSDPECADAYYNLSQLLEQSGDAQGAIRALQRYRKLRKDM